MCLLYSGINSFNSFLTFNYIVNVYSQMDNRQKVADAQKAKDVQKTAADAVKEALAVQKTADDAFKKANVAKQIADDAVKEANFAKQIADDAVKAADATALEASLLVMFDSDVASAVAIREEYVRYDKLNKTLQTINDLYLIRITLVALSQITATIKKYQEQMGIYIF